MRGSLFASAEDGLSGLCYGRIARDARPEPGTGIFRVSVEVSEGQFRDMLSTDIYSFRSAGSSQSAARGTAGNGPVVAADAEPEVAQNADSNLPSPALAPLVGQLPDVPLHVVQCVLIFPALMADAETHLLIPDCRDVLQSAVLSSVQLCRAGE